MHHRGHATRGGCSLVAVLVAIQCPPMPSRMDRSRTLVQVELIRMGKIEAANAVWPVQVLQIFTCTQLRSWETAVNVELHGDARRDNGQGPMSSVSHGWNGGSTS